MAEESIATELGKRVNEIIRLIEQRYFCDEDLIQFHLDWLYNAIVRYIDQIPSGKTVLGVVREAAEFLNASTSDDHGGDLDTNTSFHAELVPTGSYLRGRPRVLVQNLVLRRERVLPVVYLFHLIEAWLLLLKAVQLSHFYLSFLYWHYCIRPPY